MKERNIEGLKNHGMQRSQAALEKVTAVIQEMEMAEERINFNSVSLRSGIAKSYLYDTESIRKDIEERRQAQVNKKINQRAKYDKTSKSKDVIILAKDKRIADLESENKRLKSQLEILRGKLYEQ